MSTTHLAYIETFYKEDDYLARHYLADETHPAALTEFPADFAKAFPSKKAAMEALTELTHDSIYEPGTTSYGYVKLHTVPVNDAGDYPTSSH